jgi:hypothetical protein
LPSVRSTGDLEYELLAPFTAVRRPFALDAIELDAPDLGVAYGQLDEPLRVPTGYRLRLRLDIRPSVPGWCDIRRFALPPGMQPRGLFLPRRYHVDRVIAWKWLSRVGERG